MEDFMRGRPVKIILPKPVQERIMRTARHLILDELLPNPKISKIVLFGSVVRGALGEYEKRYKGRRYSDVDVLVMVDDDFTVPDDWKVHFQNEMYDVYNNGILDRKFIVQYMICRRDCYEDEEKRKEAERWGVPLMLDRSRHKHIVLHERG